MNIIIITKKESLFNLVKKIIYKKINRELMVYKTESFETIDNRWLNHLFLVFVDIDDCKVLSEKTKLDNQWKNIYYIYFSNNYDQIQKVIGYNVLGYYSYENVGLIEEKIQLYRDILLSKQNCYFKTEQGIQLFLYEDIQFFEIKNRSVYIHYRDVEERLINYKLYDIDKIIDERFVRVNQSVIINTHKIICINKHNDVVLQGKKQLPIRLSRKYLENIDKKTILINKKKHL